MRADELGIDDIGTAVDTGAVPPGERIDQLLDAAYRRALGHAEGAVADYIPVLAAADPEAFGLCIADVDGGLHELGRHPRPLLYPVHLQSLRVRTAFARSSGTSKLLEVLG